MTNFPIHLATRSRNRTVAERCARIGGLLVNAGVPERRLLAIVRECATIDDHGELVAVDWHALEQAFLRQVRAVGARN